jgi:hypothetical protein
MFVHPHCPCSRASIHELARLMAQAGPALKADLFFYRPETETRQWVETDLWAEASVMPGVTPAGGGCWGYCAG